MKYAMVFVLATWSCLAAHTMGHTVQEGVFTHTQVDKGRTLFEEACADGCHIENLMGSGPTPNLRGEDFLLRWTDFSIAEFLELIRTTMPKDKTVRLTDTQYLSVIAYVLSVNGFPAGDSALGDSVTLDEIYITAAP